MRLRPASTWKGCFGPKVHICPHCGNADAKRIHKLQGKSTRQGVYKCSECEKPFSVTVGTCLLSHVPLHKWVYAAHLLTASKKGISSHQLMRMLDVSYKTAWFMSHRIREGMRPTKLTPMGAVARSSKVTKPTSAQEGAAERTGSAHKNIVLTLVERGGKARSFHVGSTRAADVVPIVRQNIRRESRFMTEKPRTIGIGSEFARAWPRQSGPR